MPGSRSRERSPEPEHAELLRLPRFGTVQRLEENRGFGFITEGETESVFFHFRGITGRLPDGQKLPPVGTPVIFLTGSDPRRPNKNDAISWAPADFAATALDGLPTNQAALDALRRKCLDKHTLDEMLSLLGASWYVKHWGGGAAVPADLEDSVLESVFVERLVAMSSKDLQAHQISKRLSTARYAFAARMSPDNPACAFSRLLGLLDPLQLAVLGAPNASWIRKGKLGPAARSRLMEWHLISRARSQPRDDWREWFTGSEIFEADIATRFLTYGIPPDDFTNEWLKRVAGSAQMSEAQLDAWAELSANMAIALFPRLSGARQDALIATWRLDPSVLDVELNRCPSLASPLLLASALAIDLETDGECIWEIGCARNGQATLLHEERGGADLDAALDDLSERIRTAPLLVGHNLLAWDWPFVSRRTTPALAPLIWDTLLVQYLIEPQALSHSLGGSHRADQDAAAAVQLFKDQLNRLPPDMARRIMVGEFQDSMQLLDALIEALQVEADFAREPPEFLVVTGSTPTKLVLAPLGRLRELDWVPQVSVVAADSVEGLPAAWRQIDVAALEKTAPTGMESRPTGKILVAVARMVAAQGIVLRRNMIPAWLLEHDTALAGAVDAACVTPMIVGDGWRVAMLPTRVAWWMETEPSSYSVAGLNDDVLLLDRRQVTRSDVVLELGKLPQVPFLRVGVEGPALRWLLVDRAAHLLDPRGGLTAFTTFPVDRAVRVREAKVSSPACRPTFAKRHHHILYPRSEDQGTYWTEVLLAFQELAAACAGTVPILLVESSRSRSLIEILTSGLAELGLGEVKTVHRSQREHMRRAAKGGFGLVDTLDRWSVWKSLAHSAGVTLQPVVEALPIEEWHARASTLSVAQAGSEAHANVDTPADAAAVRSAVMLESLPVLIRERLHGWMADVELSTSSVPAVLIDPRMGDSANQLADFVDIVQLREVPFQSDQARRLDLVLSPLKFVREEAPAGLEAMERFLIANWQPRSAGSGNPVKGFKPSQTVAMEAICTRSANVLVPLPTGEGKSVLFQVPALCRGLRNRRLTLVISPLKALMRDQVERLREQGFSESVDYLSGDRTPSEMAEVMQGVLDHRIVLLYVAPERMRSEVFLDVLYKRMHADDGLEHVVVDETHCVNQWGYEFRPDYFHALDLLLRMCRRTDAAGPTPFLLLSATITASDKARLQEIMADGPGDSGSPLPLIARPDAFTSPLRAHIAVTPRRVRRELNDRREFDKALAERLPYIAEAIAAARQNRSSTGQRSAVIVFVSSRDHAEIVAQRLAHATSSNVDYYHAGLDSGSREEIYSSFLEGDLDVLVATKAFGMGMDIPDIHWVVHLAPPGYLEDYLQEVGRIGRGVRERERAKLEKLSATLLFSDADFESIRGMRARSALSLPTIRDLYDKLCEHAHALADQRLAIVPAVGYGSPQNPAPTSPAAQRAAATRVRMGLYWLERAGRLRLCGSVPDLIEVIAHFSALQRISLEGGVAGEVAGLILQTESSEALFRDADGHARAPEASPVPKSGFFGGITGVLGRLFSALSNTVGLLFDAPLTPPARSIPHPTAAATTLIDWTSESKTVVLNLSEMKLRAAMKSMGDVLAVLGDLEKRGGVSLNREVEVVPRKLAPEPPEKIAEQFQYVDGAVAELIRRLATKGRIEFNPFEMVEDVEGPKVDEAKLRMYERSFINGFRNLARASGIRIRQLVRADDKVIWEALLPRSSCAKADSCRKRYVQGAMSLLKAIGDQRSIRISRLVDELRDGSHDGRFRESDLNKVTGLLAAMSVVSISPDLIPLSHVVALLDAEGRLEDQKAVWDELRQVNELAEARNLAMELFANVNTDAQPAFIEGYFGAVDAADVKQFLDTQLGEIVSDDVDGPSRLLAEMQEKLRATKAVEFFERFRKSEEPSQWEVAKAPFDQHIMVNAGPGAGKTFVLVGRIAHLIREQNIDPSQIIVLAFNRAVVFEIRRRIRELFKSLGYAAHAGRLRVSTFHSLALRSLAREGIEISRDGMQTLLADFATRLAKDPSFAQRVAGGARCILVDEFQDVTDDVYQIIKHLHSGGGSRAGVLVIGDDDQDILRWQRKRDGSAHQFSEKYFEQFAREFGGDGFQEFILKVNFRSGTSIVERSQSMISKFFERASRSQRLKASQLRARTGASEGVCQRIQWRDRNWDEAIDDAATVLEGLVDRGGGSTAVLCRTNAEVAEAHRLLSRALPDLKVQGAANLRVAELRHVGLWLDHLRELAAKGDDALSEDLRQEIFSRMVQTPGIPEWFRPDTSDVDLNSLWTLCCRERSYPHLSSLIQFVDELKTDELVRLSGMVDGESTAVVSTLHKVKGLEFDNVVILPSTTQFGVSRGDEPEADLAVDAAEEARLFYVGMTRAKKNLTYYRGDREISWGQPSPMPHQGLSTSGKVLIGSMEDVHLGWAMQKTPFNTSPDECQRHIETEVTVGDPLVLGGREGGAFKCFMHRAPSGELVQVGFLAKKHKMGGPNAALRVSAVVRFRPDQLDGQLADCVRERGWGYVVLVSGRLH